jgi:hypothetical protein
VGMAEKDNYPCLSAVRDLILQRRLLRRICGSVTMILRGSGRSRSARQAREVCRARIQQPGACATRRHPERHPTRRRGERMWCFSCDRCHGDLDGLPPDRLLGRPTAVDYHRVSGDKRRFLGTEPQYGVGDFVGSGVSSHGVVCLCKSSMAFAPESPCDPIQ